MPRLAPVVLAASILVPLATARAAVTISSKPTANMTCSGGICAPTASDAMLNVGDLETLLSSGNVTVTTTGSGVQAADIAISAPLSWATSNILSLDAYQSVAVGKPVAVKGEGGLSVTTNDGGINGFFSFGPNGHITFANLSSGLAINGQTYTLVNTLSSLASAVAANPAGAYAFAANYDASADGTYDQSPVPTIFTGSFQGLGNAISNITLVGGSRSESIGGIFGEVNGGSVSNIGIVSLNLNSLKAYTGGGLVGMLDHGILTGNYVSGSIEGNPYYALGGLAGGSAGTIENCFATANVYSRKSGVGGLGGVDKFEPVSGGCQV